METAIKTGFFTMETVHAIMAKTDLEEAKQFAFSIVENSATAKSSNINKASAMINKATSVQNLAMAITNFMLAHPSENLKTIR
jgi:hypothetical protein